MENAEDYTSLQEFTEDLSSRGTQGLKRGSECLRRETALFVLIGLLVSVCANIVLSVLRLTELLVFDENKLIVFPNPKTNTSLSSFNVSFNVISSCTMSGLFTPCTASLQFFFCSVFTRLSANVPQETTAMTLRLNSVQSRYLSLCEDYTMLGQSCSKTVKKCRECPEEWTHLADKCYKFSNKKLDWLSSSQSCTTMGSHLTILHSKEQHDALEKEARRIGGTDYHFWIGLSDLEKEGDWRWVDNTTLQNKYWDQWDSEPNNHQSGGVKGEDCAVLDSFSLTWFDVECENIYKYICQMDAIQLN